MHAHLREHSLQLLVVAEEFRALRRHEHRLNFLLRKCLAQPFVHVVHLHAHQQVRAVSLDVGNESAQQKSLRLVASDGLGNADSAVLHAIDEHRNHFFIHVCQVVEILHAHTQKPHQHRGHGVGAKDVNRSQVYEFIGRQVVDPIVQHDHDDARQRVGKAHTHQVDERRVANHARIRMEKPETDEADKQINH